MDDALTLLLWCGGVGWFLFTYVAALGGSMSAPRVLVWNVFYWFIALDCVAVLFGIIGPLVRHVGIGWRFVAFFVVLPYLLSFLRLWWLRRHRRIAAPASPSTPAA